MSDRTEERAHHSGTVDSETRQRIQCGKRRATSAREQRPFSWRFSIYSRFSA